ENRDREFIVWHFDDERQQAHRKRWRHVYLKATKNDDRTENRHHHGEDRPLNQVVRQKTYGRGQQADEREHYGPANPVGRCRMSDNLIGHHDNGWEKKEAKACELSGSADHENKSHQSQRPKSVERNSLVGLNNFIVFNYLLWRINAA